MDDPRRPSRHDGVTMACAACGRACTPSGRRRFCSDACRAAAYRRRHGPASPVVAVPAGTSRMPMTVHECDGCGARAVGVQRCADCSAFMRRVGSGGVCPSCDEAVTVEELVGPGASA